MQKEESKSTKSPDFPGQYCEFSVGFSLGSLTDLGYQKQASAIGVLQEDVGGWVIYQGKVKFQSFSGSDLLTCMLPTFCPPTIWTISVNFVGSPPFWPPTIS